MGRGTASRDIMHDEYRDLIILVIVIYALIITITISIGLNLKGDKFQVNTLISRELFHR